MTSDGEDLELGTIVITNDELEVIGNIHQHPHLLEANHGKES
jgi:hypothetical protein